MKEFSGVTVAGGSTGWHPQQSFERQRRSRLLLHLTGIVVVTMVAMPLLVIVLSWASDQTDIWQHLIATQLSTLLRNTLVLALGVGVGVTLIGVSLAWLTVMCEFPGRRWLDWALMLPMAVPAYVLAFVVLGMYDFSSPLQYWLRDTMGYSRGIDIRSEATVIAVLVLVLYPYVYMLARSAFLAQGSDVMEAARILGCSSTAAFFRVALPMARPAIVAGTSLAMMETLADFGTVAMFNYDTFTTAIYKAWFGLFNLQAAAQLASLLLLFVALALTAERKSRGAERYVQGGRLQHFYRFRLPRWLGWLACTYCLVILSVAFFTPLLQLMSWTLQQGFAALDLRYMKLLWHTLSLGSMAAMLTVVLAILIAFCQRKTGSRHWQRFFSLATLGYALPGSVLAVGIMLSFTWIENSLLVPMRHVLGWSSQQWLVGSVFALIAAYWVRFLAVASGPVDAGLDRIRSTIPEAARSLGVGGWRLLWRVYLPMLRPGLLTALILVFVDVMKEMPATLLLRPFGWDTLAVRIFELTSEGEWHRAALPALTLVAVGLLPVAQAVYQSGRRRF